MDRVLTAAALAVVVLVVAAVAQRRRRPDPPANAGFGVPQQLDRGDFERPEAPWLVVVFGSTTCDSCAGVWERARHLASGQVAVQEVELSAHRQLHQRYGIDAVPTTVVVDAAGVVRRGFLGPVTATDLWAAVAEARQPGSTPGACS